MADDDQVRLARVKALLADFNPDIIPDLRDRARDERRRLGPGAKTWKMYGLDHACDWLEALFAVFPENYPGTYRWSAHDELRGYGRPIDVAGPP